MHLKQIVGRHTGIKNLIMQNLDIVHFSWHSAELFRTVRHLPAHKGAAIYLLMPLCLPSDLIHRLVIQYIKIKWPVNMQKKLCIASFVRQMQ